MIWSCILCYTAAVPVGPVHLRTCSFSILKAFLKAGKLVLFFYAHLVGPLGTDSSVEIVHLKDEMFECPVYSVYLEV